MKHHHLPHWHRGIHAVHFGFLNGLVAVVFMATVGLSVLSPSWVKQAEAAVTPFASTSFWNTPVPAYTSLHPESVRFAAAITQQVSTYGTSFNTVNSSPVYVVGADTPPVTVEVWNCGTAAPPGLASQWTDVPIPFYAVPSAGPAGQMVIYDQSSGTVWEFGYMRNVAGQWQACTGGRIATNSDGVFPSPYGMSASGLATLAAQVSPDELRSGYIDHAIGLALPQTNSFTTPATQGGGTHPNAPPLGMRFRLDPSIDVSSLGLSPAGTAIARAAQSYGLIVWNSGITVSISGHNPIAQTSRSIPNPYASIDTAAALQNFPWDRLQALPTGVAYNTAVPAITAFTASPVNVIAGSTVTLSWQSSNVNRCAVAGVGDNLPASGTVVSKPLETSTTFVLRCGGPAGAASSQTAVTVQPITSNDPALVLPPAITIDQPYSGYANIMPEIMSGAAAEKVYKVVYYSAETYLYETAKPPFALNTSRMDNGPHRIDAQIYYRDGTSEKKSIGFTVSNTPETLFATIQSGEIPVPPSIPLPVAVSGALITLLGMAIGSWWGWRKAHLI